MSALLPQAAAWAVEALVASALLMALILLVRVPVRRAFGPRVAYALWLLPVLRLILPPIPSAWRQAAVETPISRVGETITVVILPGDGSSGAIDTASSAPSLGTLLLVAWAIVAAGFLVYHLASHLTFCRRVLRRGITVDRIARVRVVESPAAAGPIAFGVLRQYVAFPSDFAERFDADERALALAHELGHHARGDLLANWIALAVLALHWFNPLAWRAFRTFRADQELANDARVLAGRTPYERHAYACAIVKAAHGKAVGAACHLHSVKDLKGRLKMLRTQISPRRLVAGAAAVATFSVAALGLTASGTSAAERIRTQVADATGIAIPAPIAPATPVAPLAPAQPARPATPSAKGVHRVVIVSNGTTTTYEGEDARRYIAAHPVPTPPEAPAAPSTPEAPTPPMPPQHAVFVSDDGAMRFNVDVPQVSSATCGAGGDDGEVVRHSIRDGHRRIEICTDRIERQGRVAERQAHAAERQAYATAMASANVSRLRVAALREALAGLRQSRASMAANRTLPEDARDDAVDAIEGSIDRLEREIDRID